MAKGKVDIRDNTRQALQSIERMSGSTLLDFTQTAHQLTVEKAPRRKVRGGTHALSIKYEDNGASGSKLKSTTLFSTAGYGGYLEFGTSKMAARPHFSKAIDAAIRAYKNGKLWGQ